MSKITAPNRKRFLRAKRSRRAKVAKIATRYGKATGAEKETLLKKALRANPYLTRQTFVKAAGK